ncbi:hypothetical protein C7I87_33880 [Mesorhizobium sp. SARCC-RB16n]|uniref:SDR family oxidoreductase n=1 Tax=Mesorhizobium sp. SARCC-RB16n TaxID=2116687 RepID=UPI00122EAE43|nr:SDR family oxidoreductase [Mesorhizobium sp. SARCC-RB16n]KAA3441863.1 hypothetical protein C7I87_33880 [Mesorhizobium sp. SARCC-RB16n]
MKLLIVGGYGTFGGRIVQLVENEPRLTVMVAGRSLARAEAWCERRGSVAARLVPAMFDRDGDLAAQLASLHPDTLVDASGPFQTYGEDCYRLVEACIEQGVNYLDLADGSDFVAGVPAFDAAARRAGLFVLSGVSSFPVLTAAVVRRLSSGVARVDTITGGIAPSPYGFRDDSGCTDRPLYADLLGDAWQGLPDEIRAMHNRAGMAEGRACVERGRNIFSRITAWLVGFPGPAADIPVRVRFDADPDGETWTRTFGPHSFSSRQFEGRGRSERLLCERFGPLTFAMALVAEGGKLKLILRRWSVLGLRLPMWLCPRSTSVETVEDGKFRFHVEISHPLTGLIVRYRGWLEPVASHRSSEIVPP